MRFNIIIKGGMNMEYLSLIADMLYLLIDIIIIINK